MGPSDRETLPHPWIVFVELALEAVYIHDDVDATQMVVVIKELLRSFLGGEGLDAEPDELGDRAAGSDLVALEREERHAGGCIFLYPHAGVIVLHGSRAAADAHTRHPVVDALLTCKDTNNLTSRYIFSFPQNKRFSLAELFQNKIRS